MSKLATWVRGGRGPRRSGGVEFSSQSALNAYLRLHPHADRSKHSVAQAAQPRAAEAQKKRPTHAGGSPPANLGSQPREAMKLHARFASSAAHPALGNESHPNVAGAHAALNAARSDMVEHLQRTGGDWKAYLRPGRVP